MKKTILFTLLFAISFQMNAQNDWQKKIAQSLWDKQQETEIQFFVYLKTQANLQLAKQIKNKNEKGNFVYNALISTAERTQQPLINLLEQEQAFYQSFAIVNGIWVKGDFELVKLMAQQSEVANVFYNAEMQIIEPLEVERNPNLALRNDSLAWGIVNMNANTVWSMGYRGQGVVVGGQDTGYSWEVPELKKKYRGWDGSNADHNYNWHDAIHDYSPLGDSINPCGLDLNVPCDDHGHGTHTVGTMVAEDSVVKFGVAPDAQWIGCRNMEHGWGSPQTYLECFEWFLAPTDLNDQNANPSKAPHVINNSWGCPTIEGCDTSNFVLLDNAVNNLKLAGVVVVVSAGNSGSSCHSVNNPAAIFEGSFSVGALGVNDTITNFSSRGSVTSDGSNRLKPNVTAPGQAVTSYWANGPNATNFSYLNASGTSMAGPHVAGLVALMISADSTLAGDVDRIEDIIERTARPRYHNQTCNWIDGSTTSPNNTYGYGTVDALAAINEAINTANTTNQNPNEGQAEVFPNPFTNQVWVKLEGFTGNTTFELYSVDGKLIQQEVWDISWHTLRQVDIKDIPIGIYFYRIFDGKSSTQGKLMKQF
jgi:subtilisin family serine protease